MSGKRIFIAVAVVLFVVGQVLGFCRVPGTDLLFFLAFGWVFFLARVVPKIAVRWDLVASTAVYLAVLVVGSHLFVRWLYRDGVAPGESTLLVDAVAALDPPAGTDDVFAWVGAESAAVRAVRADLRGRWGLGRAQHHAIGYWRRGRAMSPAG